MSHDTPEAIAITDRAERELLEVERLKAANAELLRVMKCIAHNGKIKGMNGFTEWAAIAAESAIKSAEAL